MDIEWIGAECLPMDELSIGGFWAVLDVIVRMRKETSTVCL